MKSMKSHNRLLVFLLLVLALTCILSPLLAAGSDWVTNNWPRLQDERYPFSRIFNRTFMLAGIILFFVGRRFLGFGRISELGLPAVPSAPRDVIAGWVVAVLSVIALVVTMTLSDVFTPFFRQSLADTLSKCAGALVAGLLVATLEELFFRGILFRGLLEYGRPLYAFIVANLFYSAIHFVKPGEPYFLDHFDAFAGFRHLLWTFKPFLDPLSITPGVFGLFLIGVALSYAYLRTKTLYLAIGLHAGWIFGIKTVRVFGNYTREDLGWLFGSTDPKIISGLAAWIGIVLVCLLIHRITQQRTPAAGTSPKPVQVGRAY
jgi:membrane protease YdiL (CAAX protease family)